MSKDVGASPKIDLVLHGDDAEWEHDADAWAMLDRNDEETDGE